MKEELKKTIKKSLWALHFDGKKIKQKEVQVVVLKNNHQEIKLAALFLKDGKAKTIVSALINLLNEFDIWEVIKVIICGATNTITGAKVGVVYLKKEFITRRLEVPQYIGCQHHVLDLLLKHVWMKFLEAKHCHQTSIIFLLMNW